MNCMLVRMGQKVAGQKMCRYLFQNWAKYDLKLKVFKTSDVTYLVSPALDSILITIVQYVFRNWFTMEQWFNMLF